MSDAGVFKFLCFNLGERVFALDIMGIREILRLMPVTPVPEAPEAVLGIINVRGELLTVLDGRRLFGVVAEEAPKRESRIIVGSHQGARFGILVDSVMDVASVEGEGIGPPPGDSPMSTVLGIFRRPGDEEGRVVILLRMSTLARISRGDRTVPNDPFEIPREVTPDGSEA